MISIGTAGWAIPKPLADAYPGDGSRLARYATSMACVEINSSFHRPHRIATYARWADETPAGFRFAAKLPKTITHRARFVDCGDLLDTFLAEVAGLGDKLDVLLVQLPPSFAFDAALAGAFFATLRSRYAGTVVCEPRHATWFDAEADALLVDHRIGRAAADPARVDAAETPGGWLSGDDGRPYYRWHGSPRMYWSAYDDDWLAGRAAEVLRWSPDRDVWCLFDNTTLGAALDDARRFAAMLEALSPGIVARSCAP